MPHREVQLALVADEPATSGAALLPHLLSIAKSVRQLVGIKLAECEVAPGQDQFLLCFADETPRSVAEIADRLSVRASTVSKMIDILEAKEWVSRRPDSHDARKVLISLTMAGCEVRSEVSRVWRSLEAELASGLSDRTLAVAVLSEVEKTVHGRLRRLR